MSDSTEKCTACGADIVTGEPTCSACGAAVLSAEEPAANSAEPSAPTPAPVVGSYRVDEDGQPAEPVPQTPSSPHALAALKQSCLAVALFAAGSFMGTLVFLLGISSDNGLGAGGVLIAFVVTGFFLVAGFSMTTRSEGSLSAWMAKGHPVLLGLKWLGATTLALALPLVVLLGFVGYLCGQASR